MAATMSANGVSMAITPDTLVLYGKKYILPDELKLKPSERSANAAKRGSDH